MLAKVGDIYSAFSSRLQQYVACQVTAADVQAMRPLVCDYYFWNRRHDHSFVDARVPRHYTLVANIAPLLDVAVKSYSGGWHVGESVWRQRRRSRC